MANLLYIDESNIDMFAPIIPDYIREVIVSDEDVVLHGIESDDMACGVVVSRVISFEAEILWYYLDPSFRGYGIGHESFQLYAERMHNTYGVSSIRVEIPAGVDKSIYNLFSGLPAEFERLDMGRFETTVGWLRSSEKIRGAAKHSVALSAVDSKALRNFSDKLANEGLGMVDLPIDPRDYEADASAVYMEDDTPKAVLLLQRDGEALTIPYMVSLSSNPVAIMDMICFVKENSRKYSEDAPIYMDMVEPRLSNLIRGLLDIEPGDNDGFVYNQMVTLDLTYIDERMEEAMTLIRNWKSETFTI
ncbi:MAG: hypothetical protein K6E19_02860 [Lachnospiraceae bacterium]|nr:hypothetical protein [Lachnospiraceae bacterium]